jgi:hypothetical protein
MHEGELVESCSGVEIAFVDSGSAISSITEKMVKQYRLQQAHSPNLVARSVFGEAKLLERIVNLPIVIKGKDRGSGQTKKAIINLRCRVVEEGVGESILIGSSDMEQVR